MNKDKYEWVDAGGESVLINKKTEYIYLTIRTNFASNTGIAKWLLTYQLLEASFISREAAKKCVESWGDFK